MMHPGFCFAVAVTLLASSESYAQVTSDTTVKVISVPRNPGVGRLVSEMQLGGAHAVADEYMFSLVQEVFPLRDGSLIVVDRGMGALVVVRVYDATGKYVRTLGRFGEGPGEYIAPSGVGQLPDGRILVRDGRGGRVSIFSPDGGAKAFYSTNSAGTITVNGMLTVGQDGIVYIGISLRSQTVPRVQRPAYVRVRIDGTVIDTIFSPTLPRAGPPDLTAMRQYANGTSTTRVPVPFAPSVFSALSPLGYFVTGNTGRYAIDLRIPGVRVQQSGSPPLWKEGDRVTSIRRVVRPVAANDSERGEWRKWAEEQLVYLDSTWKWSGLDIPRVKPPLTAVSVGIDGRIWVQVATLSEKFAPNKSATGPAGPTPVTWRATSLFDLIDPDGTYIGQVLVPFDVSVLARNGDIVWGTTRDSDDVLTLHRFRITWR